MMCHKSGLSEPEHGRGVKCNHIKPVGGKAVITPPVSDMLR